MDQTTKTQLTTDTRTAVLLVTGMIGAFMVGMGFLMFFSRVSSDQLSAPAEPEVPPIIAMTLYGVDNATAQADPATTHTTDGDMVTFKAAYAGMAVNDYPVLGTYQTGNGFMSNYDVPDQARLMIEINSETHGAMVISLERDTSASTAAAPAGIFGIPTAHAQVNISASEPICLPERSLGDLAQRDEPTWLPTAHAQVNLEECTEGEINGCYICAGGQWQYDMSQSGCDNPPVTQYYVDSQGNVYSDFYLQHQVNTVSCPTQVARHFSPNDVSEMVFSSPEQIDLGENGSIYIGKSWDNLLGNYIQGTFTNMNEDFLSKAPMFLVGSNVPNDQLERTIGPSAFTLMTDTGARTLCLPETTVAADNFFYYFYDADGTPYHDMSLTQPAMTTSCATLLGSSLAPMHVSQARFNVPPADPYDSQLYLGLYRDSITMGNWDPNGTFQGSVLDAPEIGSTAPLHFAVENTGSAAISLPANTLTIRHTQETDLNPETEYTTSTLCIPAVDLTAWQPDDDTTDTAVFFFDTEGTPYYDSTLTQPAMTTSCATLLGSSLAPMHVSQARFNVSPLVVAPSGPLSLGLYRSGTSLGTWDPNGTYQGSVLEFPMANSASPLYYAVENMYDQEKTLPANTISIMHTEETDLNPETVYLTTTLCVPSVHLTAWDPNTETTDTAVFFFDSEGTPYYDSTLTQPAMDGSCADTLTESLTISEVTGGTWPYVPSGDVVISLVREGTALGTVNYDGSIISSYQPMEILEGSLAPFHTAYQNYNVAVALQGGTATVETSTGELNLCIPSFTLAGEWDSGTYGNGLDIFYYDQSGTPYSDSLLQNEVSCGNTPENLCATVNCDKQPTHVCCIIQGGEENQVIR